ASLGQTEPAVGLVVTFRCTSSRLAWPTNTSTDSVPERQRLHGQVVGSPDGRPVVAQEGRPGLAGRTRRSAPAVPLDGGLADGDARLEQLAADPLGAPPWVLPRHPGDHVPDLAPA